MSETIKLNFSLEGLIEVDEMAVRAAALDKGVPPEIANSEGMVARGLHASGGADIALGSLLSEALRRGLAGMLPAAEIVHAASTASFADGRPTTQPGELGDEA